MPAYSTRIPRQRRQPLLKTQPRISWTATTTILGIVTTYFKAIMFRLGGLRAHIHTGGTSPLSRFKRPASLRPSRPSKPSRPSLTSTRNYHQNGGYQEQYQSWPPVRVLGPSAWTIMAVGTFYFTCAAYDVYQDVKRYPKDRQRSLDFDTLETDSARRRRRERQHDSELNLSDGPRAAWDSLGGPQKVIASVTATNAAMLLLERVPAPFMQQSILRLAHTPVDGMFRNSQLLTSAFLHTGPLHLFVNTFVLFNFAPLLARGPDLGGSGSHTLAFFLSGAVVSALGSHVSCLFGPNKSHRFRPGMGFSGVVSAVFAAWCVENPDARVRVFPLPFEFTALGMLQASASFEALGALGLWARLRLPLDVAFAAHLTGMAFGAAYVAYGRKGEVWHRSRRVAFRALKTSRII